MVHIFKIDCFIAQITKKWEADDGKKSKEYVNGSLTISKTGAWGKPGPINVIESVTSINHYYLEYKEHSSKKQLHYTYILRSLPMQFSVVYYSSEHSSFLWSALKWYAGVKEMRYWVKEFGENEIRYLYQLIRITLTTLIQLRFFAYLLAWILFYSL